MFSQPIAPASPLTRWLSRVPAPVFALYGGVMAFGAYFAMYAFRKPFTAAEFAGMSLWGIDYKIILVITQVFGYALSKFAGIRIISELPGRWRAVAILALIAVAEAALCAFAVVPAPYNILCLFLNGLPLGLIWGLVFGFLEGRRTSEILGSILCASFIVSSGVVKSVGKWLLLSHYANDFSMPAMTGLIFTPLLLVCVWGLAQLPPPDVADVAARTERRPMDKAARKALFSSYAPGLIALVVLYIFLTALRDFRDNFAAEIWTGLGFGDKADVFAASELPIGAVVLVAMAVLTVFRDNRAALWANFALVGIGLVLTAGATLAFEAKLIAPFMWMMLVGGGLYLAYTPFNGILFDRLLAATGRVGTAGFLIYVADSSGYAGSVGLLLFRNFSSLQLPWVPFLEACALVTGGVGIALLIYATLYMARRLKA